MQRINDPEVLLIASIASTIGADYLSSEESQWAGSPFEWIRRESSGTRGSIGEKLVAGWCAAKDFDVVRSPSSDADRIINGLHIEIKTSTLWKNGSYTFQQIRNQDYDRLFALGISPFDVHAWLIPKDVLTDGLKKRGLRSQHGGSRGTDTAWLTFRASSPPPWLEEYGGTLSAVFELLRLAPSSRA